MEWTPISLCLSHFSRIYFLAVALGSSPLKFSGMGFHMCSSCGFFIWLDPIVFDVDGLGSGLSVSIMLTHISTYALNFCKVWLTFPFLYQCFALEVLPWRSVNIPTSSFLGYHMLLTRQNTIIWFGGICIVPLECTIFFTFVIFALNLTMNWDGSSFRLHKRVSNSIVSFFHDR